MNTFESIVRIASKYSEEKQTQGQSHPFEIHEIHHDLPNDVKKLFDNAHYAQATFEASKFLDRIVAKIAKSSDIGKSLMMKAFNEISPQIRLNGLSNESEVNEQEGYKYIFAGTMIGIRNPRGHEVSIYESVSECLEHLELITHLLRKLEKAGFIIPKV